MKLFLLIVLLNFTVFNTALGQEIPEMRVVEQGSLQESEFVASIIRDVNGRIAAGLIIESDMIGLAYESNNGIIKRDIKPGRDFLFLSPDERIVTVYKSGYKPLKIVLAEHNVRLRSGMVFKISISADKKLIEVPSNFVTNPSDATILINSDSVLSGSTVKLLEGKYLVSISKEGYESISDSITVNSEQTLFTYTLVKREFQSISIKTVPDQATIFLENENVGLSDLVLFKQTGRYPIRISKAGFSELSDTLEVTSSKENVFAYSLITNAGVLNLKLNARDASISLNKEDYSGKSQIYLKPGVYQLEIQKFGYESYSELIEIKKNEVVEREINLIIQNGSLRVTLFQKKAKASIYQIEGDFTLAWEGDKTITDIPAGRYTIALQLPEYFPIQEEILIEPGAAITKYFEFTDDMLVNARLKTEKNAPKPQNKKGAVFFYYQKNTLNFKNSEYSSIVKNSTYNEFGIGMISDHTYLNIGFLKASPEFSDAFQLFKGSEYAMLFGDMNLKLEFFDLIHPYAGLGYLLSNMQGDLKKTILDTSTTDVYNSPYYRYGFWATIGDGSGIHFGVGYDYRKSFNSKIGFESKGWMLSIILRM